jgi:hypothetical protein
MNVIMEHILQTAHVIAMICILAFGQYIMVSVKRVQLEPMPIHFLQLLANNAGLEHILLQEHHFAPLVQKEPILLHQGSHTVVTVHLEHIILFKVLLLLQTALYVQLEHIILFKVLLLLQIVLYVQLEHIILFKVLLLLQIALYVQLEHFLLFKVLLLPLCVYCAVVELVLETHCALEVVQLEHIPLLLGQLLVNATCV